MASLANYFLLFISLSILGLTQARNFQFFSKIPATYNKNIDPPNHYYSLQGTNFVPDNGNGYGLDSQMSEQENDQLPSSTDTSTADESIQTSPSFVPDDFNPVAHLIDQPEHSTTPLMAAFTTDPNTNNYKGGNSQQDGFSNSNGGGFQLHQQGMSDTRFLENGKYFYDVNADDSNNYPYEKRIRPGHDYSNMMNYYYSRHHYGDNGGGGAYGLGKENYPWEHEPNRDKFQGQEINNIP